MADDRPRAHQPASTASGSGGTQPHDASTVVFYDRDGHAIELPTLLRLLADPAYRFLARDLVATPAGDIAVVTAWLGIDQRTSPEAGERALIFGTAAVLTDRDDALLEDREWLAATEEDALRNHADLLHRVRAGPTEAP